MACSGMGARVAVAVRRCHPLAPCLLVRLMRIFRMWVSVDIFFIFPVPLGFLKYQKHKNFVTIYAGRRFSLLCQSTLRLQWLGVGLEQSPNRILIFIDLSVRSFIKKSNSSKWKIFIVGS